MRISRSPEAPKRIQLATRIDYNTNIGIRMLLKRMRRRIREIEGAEPARGSGGCTVRYCYELNTRMGAGDGEEGLEE